ncbi:hypothetical protein Zm00014a_030912 [Zea mays]|uniref:Uncharacterized protein n=1 Tax=Zea mays TaxID=4577 RepID=A0A3L6DZZ7_MAIZE|nr:hypothetical protein Zm00014a_030912 [Zea mays]
MALFKKINRSWWCISIFGLLLKYMHTISKCKLGT